MKTVEKFNGFTQGTFNFFAGLKENNYILISYIDSAACTLCSLTPLTYWKYRKYDMNRFKINIILIIQNSDHELINHLLDDSGISHPVIFDEKGEFLLKNNLFDNNIIINEDKKVIWTGNPVGDDNEWNMFIRKLELLNKQKR